MICNIYFKKIKNTPKGAIRTGVIHAPHAGCDKLLVSHSDARPVSIHASRVGCDYCSSNGFL